MAKEGTSAADTVVVALAEATAGQKARGFMILYGTVRRPVSQ
jgi:phage tail sheath gpL-like